MAGGLNTMLQEFLKIDSILVVGETRTFETLIKELCLAMLPALRAAEPEKLSGEALAKAVLHREQAASTAVGFGCAIPHAAVASLAGTAVGMALLKKPLAMATPDSEKVDIVFLMLGPVSDARTHLKLLSKIARVLHSQDAREKIRACKDPKQVWEVVSGLDED